MEDFQGYYQTSLIIVVAGNVKGLRISNELMKWLEYMKILISYHISRNFLEKFQDIDS